MPRIPLLPRGSTLKWMLIALVAAPPVLLAFFLLLSSAFSIQVELDLAAILFAVGAVFVAITLVQLVRYWMQPKSAVTVGYNYRFVQPALPIGRYTFRLEVFYDLHEKGEHAQIQQGTIELKFRRNDHPEILAWCCEQVTDHLARHRRLASERFPRANVMLGPALTPGQLAGDVAWVEEGDVVES